jgi:hypothetical protein
LKEKFGRFKERYTDALEAEEIYAFNPQTAPKDKVLHSIEYAYVTFKSNQAPRKTLSMFVKETTSSKVMRRFCFIED